MDDRYAQLEQAVSASALLGYLNFSDGRPDPRWQKQFNDAYAFLAEHGEPAPWQALFDWLSASLRTLHEGGSAAFRDVTQAENILALAARTLPAYRRHHADLLAHLDDRNVFGPFFLRASSRPSSPSGPPEPARTPTPSWLPFSLASTISSAIGPSPF